MESQESISKIKNQLTSKWPKLPASEVKDIASHHDHLSKALQSFYKMDAKKAKQEEQHFFEEVIASPKKSEKRY